MPEELKGLCIRPRRAVVGLLPYNEFKVGRRDGTPQSLPRVGGDSRDGMGTEWEAVVLRVSYGPASESGALSAPPPDRAASLFAGMCDWHEASAPAARAASFGGLGLSRQFRFPCAESVCHTLHESFLSLQFCTKPPLIGESEDPG